MYECKNCGGELRFDIASQKVVCEHCDSVFSPDEYDREYFAAEDAFETNVFRCATCGGEITSTTLSAVEYCPYCGRFTMLPSMKSLQKKPREIMPFEITKEEAKDAYRRYVGKSFYAPSRMKDEKFLESFRGMYLPFWSYDVSFSGNPDLKKTYERRAGSYIVKDTYGFTGDLDASYEGIKFDASSRFEDDMSRQTMPYEEEKVRPFNPSYMFGFYGEVADVSSEVYRKEAEETASREVFRKIDEAFPEDKLEFPDKENARAKALGASAGEASCVMAPVWFMTWRHGKNVVYSVVNGQTGKTYADIPVSIAKFLAGTALLAVPLFALFWFLIPTPSIYTMLLLTSLVGCCAISLYRSAVTEIFIVKKRLRDKGYLSLHPSDIKPADLEFMEFDIRDLLAKTLVFMWGELGFFFSLAVLFYLGSYLMDLTRRQARTGGYAILFAAALIELMRIFLGRAAENKKKALLDVGGSAAALLTAAAVHLLNPAHDSVYYAAAVFVIAGVLWTLLSLIRLYNDMATHPDPHFFEPEDAKKKRKRAAAGAAALLLLSGLLASGIPAPSLAAEDTAAEVSEGELSDFDWGVGDGIVYTNPTTGYAVRIRDGAELLRQEELQRLTQAMVPVTQYGNAGFYTKTDGADTEEDIRHTYRAWFGAESGTVFLIDMGNRNIWIHSDGDLYRVITREWADVITDNIYRHATAGDYGECAYLAYAQILTRLQGGKVNNGLKVGTGLLLSLLVSMLVNYLLILRMRNKRSIPDQLAPLLGAAAIFALTGTKKVRRGSRRTYSPIVISGGGGGSFGGGGGGSSGGGGGHGF
ncbi:MAG: TPM domain-containing protein [Lachnospiraceae bacterium]|nr:TPM domain-containing protein [Lachnospiraceae bacterium]